MSGAAPVTVIGLGPMGQAMARALMAGGHPVTVWNRTPSRADELVAAGATPAPSPAAAIGASELTILSLTDYGAAAGILGPAADALGGRVLVNLSSDTPDVTREAAEWAAGRGARFVAGGIMVPAPAVGTDGAYVFYSGSDDAFQEHQPTLRRIGEPRWLGPDPGLAQLFYQAHLDVFLTTLSGLVHAIALVRAGGAGAADFVPGALELVAEIPAIVGDGHELARRIEAGEHPGDLSTTTMMGATAGHILSASESAGVDLELPRAIKSHYDRAIAAGHGGSDWTSLYEVIRPARAGRRSR